MNEFNSCMLPKYLKPVNKGNYYISECPNCSHELRKNEKTLFWYKNSAYVECNRKNKCGYRASIYKIPNNPKALVHLENRRYKKRNGLVYDDPDYIDMTKKELPRENVIAGLKIENGINKCDDDEVLSYLHKRIPGINCYTYMQKSGEVSSREYVKGKNTKWVHRDYRFITPLRCLETGQIVTGQMRRISKSEGAPKTLSLKGLSYPFKGVSFGHLKNAIKEAKKEQKKKKLKVPRLIVVEGDIDYHTVRACRVKNVVGVPGAAQAKKILKYLISIGWRGQLLVSLDGDEAGTKGMYEMTLITSFRNHGIELRDARPKDGMDINDVYNTHGGEIRVEKIPYEENKTRVRQGKWNRKEAKRSVLRLFENADHYLGGPEIQERDKQKDLLFLEIQEKRLWAKSCPLEEKEKDRIIDIIKESGGKESPIRHVGRAAMCGRYKETVIGYREDEVPVHIRTKTKVAENPVCGHCCASQWNRVLAPHMLEHWPEDLYVGLVPFPQDDLETCKRKMSEIFEYSRNDKENRLYFGDEQGKNLFVIADFLKSHIVVVSAGNKNDVIMRKLRAFVDFEEQSRDSTIRFHLKSAYMSYSMYIKHAVQDLDNDILKNDIITKRFKRYHYREGLAWPKQKEIREKIREDVSSYVKEQERLIAKDTLRLMYRDKDFNEEDVVKEFIDEYRPEWKYEMHVGYRHKNNTPTRILSVSPKSVSFSNLFKKDVFNEKMNFNPKDKEAVNYLEYPNRSPIPVHRILNDLYWIHNKKPMYADKSNEIKYDYDETKSFMKEDLQNLSDVDYLYEHHSLSEIVPELKENKINLYEATLIANGFKDEAPKFTPEGLPLPMDVYWIWRHKKSMDFVEPY